MNCDVAKLRGAILDELTLARKRGLTQDDSIADALLSGPIRELLDTHDRLMDSEWLAGYRAGFNDSETDTRCGRWLASLPGGHK